MIRLAIIFSILLALAAGLPAQGTAPEPSTAPETRPSVPTTPVPTPTPITTTTLKKRGLFGRVLHPFSSSEVLPKYEDRKLRGLVLNLQVSPQPVRLSEVRQMEVKVIVTNLGSHVVTLEFPTDQRIEVQLLNAADTVLTKWSENHAFKDTPSSILVNP